MVTQMCPCRGTHARWGGGARHTVHDTVTEPPPKGRLPTTSNPADSHRSVIRVGIPPRSFSLWTFLGGKWSGISGSPINPDMDLDTDVDVDLGSGSGSPVDPDTDLDVDPDMDLGVDDRCCLTVTSGAGCCCSAVASGADCCCSAVA